MARKVSPSVKPLLGRKIAGFPDEPFRYFGESHAGVEKPAIHPTSTPRSNECDTVRMVGGLHRTVYGVIPVIIIFDLNERDCAVAYAEANRSVPASSIDTVFHPAAPSARMSHRRDRRVGFVARLR